MDFEIKTNVDNTPKTKFQIKMAAGVWALLQKAFDALQFMWDESWNILLV